MSIYMFFITILLLSFKLFVIANDIVVNSTINPNWSSLTFIIPVDLPHNFYWSLCKMYTNYYCLVAYIIEEDGESAQRRNKQINENKTASISPY